MPTYRNTFNGRSVESDAPMGYPWIEEVSGELQTPEYEVAVRTADAILADVGEDGELAQEAIDYENRREHPRTSLITRLERIVRNAEDD